MSGQAFDAVGHQRRACVVAGVALGLGLLTLAGRLIQINTELAPRLVAVRDAQHHGMMVVPGRRGSIFDCRGRVVADSRQVYGLFADPAAIHRPDVLAARIAPIVGLDAGALEDRIRNSAAPRFCWLKHHLEEAEATALRAAGEPGVHLVHEWAREYPLETSLAHVLGFVGDEARGLEGLESACDGLLRGVDGRVWTVRDALRRSIGESPDSRRSARDPIDGNHVVLTIDSVIQGFVETHLAKQAREYQAEGGVGIVLDPATGDILAMASWPTFHPGQYGRVPRRVWRNRAVTDAVEPGSTFKPFIAGGALARGVVSPGEMIDCHNGLYVIGGRRLHDAHPHGRMTFEEVVIRSSNIGMAIVGERLGNPALHEIVRCFGFGQRTGIDFPGEAEGIVLPLERWNSYSTTSVPMGHEIAVTPLQLVTAFSAFVNEGLLLRPRLIRAFLSPDGQVLEEFTGPEPLRRVLPARVARYFAGEVLTRVVSEGTGRRAKLEAYRVLGKTGTAQVPCPDRRGYQPDAYIGSFIGAAPAEAPRVTALVMIHQPNARKGYYGGLVAAPAVKRILADTLAYLQVPSAQKDNGPTG